MSAITHDAWLNTPEAAHHLKVSKQYLEKLRCWGGGPRFSLLGRPDEWAALSVTGRHVLSREMFGFPEGGDEAFGNG